MKMYCTSATKKGAITRVALKRGERFLRDERGLNEAMFYTSTKSTKRFSITYKSLKKYEVVCQAGLHLVWLVVHLVS